MQLSLCRGLLGLFIFLFISSRDARGQETFQGMVQIYGNEEGAAVVNSKQWQSLTKTMYTYIPGLFQAPVVSGTVREYYIVIRKADDIYDCDAGPHFRFWFEQLGKAGHEFTPSRDWGSINAGTILWIKIPDNVDQVYAIANRDGTGTPHFSHFYWRLDVRMPDGCPLDRTMKIYSIFVAAIDKVGGASAPIVLNNNPAAAEVPRFATGGPGGTIITYQGNVGVGTLSPQSKLAVNGTITATKVKVTQTGWSDFVFKENYPLRSLAEVESFIKTNQHLPDIPSEKEVTESGNDLGEMDKKLLQKIEELTLYLIDLKKESMAMKARLEKLEKK